MQMQNAASVADHKSTSYHDRAHKTHGPAVSPGLQLARPQQQMDRKTTRMNAIAFSADVSTNIDTSSNCALECIKIVRFADPTICLSYCAWSVTACNVSHLPYKHCHWDAAHCNMQPTTAMSRCILHLLGSQWSKPSTRCAHQQIFRDTFLNPSGYGIAWHQVHRKPHDLTPMQRLLAASLTLSGNSSMSLMTQQQIWKPQPPCNVDMKTMVSPSSRIVSDMPLHPTAIQFDTSTHRAFRWCSTMSWELSQIGTWLNLQWLGCSALQGRFEHAKNSNLDCR